MWFQALFILFSREQGKYVLDAIKMASARPQFPTKSTPNQIQFIVQVIHHQSEWLVRFLLPHDALLAVGKPITNSPTMAGLLVFLFQ
jgi:hypothetical protein